MIERRNSEAYSLGEPNGYEWNEMDAWAEVGVWAERGVSGEAQRGN
jgi:hypothetical protein